MVFKNFRINIIIRILGICLNVFLIFFLVYSFRYQFSVALLVILLALQAYSLFLYVEKTNKKLTQFLQSIKYSDFSAKFSDPRIGRSFRNLNNAFNEVIQDFRDTRAEKEEHFNYMQTVVQHISIGIIAFNSEGKIDLFNNAAKKILKLKQLFNVNDLADIKPELPEILLRMKAGENTLVKLFVQDELLQIAIHATEFRMHEQDYVLVSMQNIHTELEEKEIESWQKLIRVLTHEIMNSMTPISSLASTVKSILINEELSSLRVDEIDDEDVESVISALNTIQSRSQALLNFVEIYRNLTRIPKPNFRYFPIKDLLERASQLLKPKFEDLNIESACRVMPPELMITADPDLVDQVIINLMLNAIDAVRDQENASVSLVASSNENGRVIIEVSDNGSGIKPDIMDKIFMPFFTSKKHGSGIGLSLSRQIMHLHKGSVSVKSKPDEGTIFTLTF